MNASTQLWQGRVPPNAGSVLSKIGVFNGFSEAGLAAIARHAIVEKYPKGKPIFEEDEPAGSVWFVVDGHVKVSVSTQDGRVLILKMVGPGHLMGIGAFLGTTYGLQGSAETETLAVRFPVQVIQALMTEFPEIARYVTAQISLILRHLQESRTQVREKAKKRILRILLDMAKEFGPVIPLTRLEIAEMARTAVETAIRVLSTAKEEGQISSRRGMIIVRDPQRLAQELEELE